MSASIHLHSGSNPGCGANALTALSRLPIALRVKDLVQLLEALHACTRRSHNKNEVLAPVNICKENLLTLRRVDIKSNNNVKIGTTDTTTSNHQLRRKALAATQLGHINIA